MINNHSEDNKRIAKNTIVVYIRLFITTLVGLLTSRFVLQARNQMKFRSLLYIVIAFVSLIFQIILAKYYGSIGCACAISGALVIGQIIIMNIYYQKRQGIDIAQFWKEITKMSILPLLLVFSGLLFLNYFKIHSILTFIMAIACFSAVYLPLFWRFSMNNYERELVAAPFRKIIHK